MITTLETVVWKKTKEGGYKMVKPNFVEVEGLEAANEVNLKEYRLLEQEDGKFLFMIRANKVK
jgi:hypothetical protein